MTEQWGPWIEHDGKHRPHNGSIVQKEYANGLVLIGMVGARPKTALELGVPPYLGRTFSCSWVWSGWGLSVPIIRYRIRKPRALIQLIDMVENLPAPTERVEA